jgi:hypothetical protein
MARINLTKDEERDIKAALKGLKAASRRAIKSGLSLTLVENGNLIRREATGITVIKPIPRIRVTAPFKKAVKRVS